MTDGDWGKIAFQVGTYLLSTLAGLVVGAWKWGRDSAKQEQKVKDDYTLKIDTLRDDFTASMAASQKAADARIELLVDQFKESFEGIRRQIDKNQLDTEKDFMRKEDFKDFREEYREDMRDLKKSIAEMANTKH